MSTTPPESKMPIFVNLQTNDGVVHTVDIRLAHQLGETICGIMRMEEGCYSFDIIPLPRINGEIMAFIIKWCTLVQDLEDNVMTRSKEIFLNLLKKDMAQPHFLLQLLKASDYLGMENFTAVGAKLLAEAINTCRNSEEICYRFNVDRD
ncbi:S-phase kinase-associated protein 1 [Drosophila rhopaloa]|uniref:SKP1 component POZ domain-containing protein n=1 Tax=Drosophila rhopaloa TaxID=1041015 RepID=A0ABM5J484_DRORH|nr:S-phase kinase-associated protein 1 [Drosophila rhopaloa]